MIPIRDENAGGRFPVITVLLIAANIAVFVYQAYFGPRGFEGYVGSLGLVPNNLTRHFYGGLHGVAPAPISIFTAMFMHGGILHLLGNMWFLWIFGDNIEDALGRGRFLIFYVVTGVVASITHVVINPTSTMPLVGASGAIAGVLGAYFLLFPRNRILTFVPIFIFITTVRIPAAFYLGLWFLMQLLYSMAGGGVAWWAHIGGFVSGLILVRVFLPTRR